MTLAVTLAVALVAGCGGGSGATSVPPPGGSGTPGSATASGLPAANPSILAPSASAPAGRPSSPAVVGIVSPTNDEVVTGSSVHVVLSLQNAVIVQATTTAINPGQGHIHLYVDGSLYSMNYSLEQDLPVSPGTYQLKAEFVASDHAPFNPRVWSPVVVFTVH